MVEDNALELSSTQDLSVYDLETDDVDFCPVTPPAAISCGDIVIRDSKDVHVGNRTYYTGQVTIKQIVVPGDEAKLEAIGALPDGTLPAYNKSTNPLCESKDLSNGEKVGKFLSQWVQSPRNILLLICAAGLVCVVVFVSVYLSSKTQDGVEQLPTNISKRIVSRGEWAAEITKDIPPLSVNPPHFVVVAHTAGSNCSTKPTCSAKVRDIQAGHLALGWDDISYNFLVGGDGYAYEGRGWGKTGAHTIPFNRYSIGISFIGNFMTYLPPKRQIEAFQIVLEEGVKLGKLPANYKILFHKQIWATESPGAELIEVIKTWDHWSVCDEECSQIIKKWKYPKNSTSEKNE